MSNWVGWKRWFTPSRLVPLLTILGAGTAIVLSLFKVVQLSTADEIIIALLALVSIDALNERLSLLEKIETRLGNLSVEQTLKTRHSLKSPLEEAKYASEICICVIHGTSIIFPYFGFYKSKIEDGCDIRIILLNPDSPSIEGLNLLIGHLQTKQHILSALEGVKGLLTMNARGKCEVRLTNTFIPFSMFAVDMKKGSGSMNVEYSAYRVSIDEKPHVLLTVSNCPHWFNYYKQQFEQIWSDAVTWTP